MKTFKDLEFKNHVNAPYFEKQATIHFENGYGVSVISGEGAYTNKSQPYEVAILYKESICYDTDITNDVIGYNTEEDVTSIMERVQRL